jgi:thiol peroxidase
MDRAGAVTFKGTPLTLVGAELSAGKAAPDFTIINNKLEEVSLKDLAGSVVILSVTPSLDTPVCDAQARRFNEEASKLGESVKVVNVSMDLPFAASKFCSTNGLENITTLSDHRDASFGTAYGLLIKELRLLNRAIMVIDTKGTIKHFEMPTEMTSEVDFDAALKAASELMSGA